MSQENLDLVVRAFTAALARPKPDFETMNELFAEDHVLVPVGVGLGIEGEAKGIEGYRAWREDVGEVLDPEHDLRGAVDLGHDKVLAVTVTRFTGGTSGVSGEARIWNVVTVRGGKIVRTEAYTDPDAALVAAGP